MSRPAQIPTPANAEAAWERYTEIARRVVDDPTLLFNRTHCETLARAWAEFRDLFLEMDR